MREINRNEEASSAENIDAAVFIPDFIFPVYLLASTVILEQRMILCIIFQ